MIKKIGNTYAVTTSSGDRILGKHKTKKEASAQLAAIEISKAKHMKENKTFKLFRSELTEAEYKETLTGYSNRSIDTDLGPIKHDRKFLLGVNAVLNALSRFTYQNPNDAFIKLKTRLNLFMLDFPWTPTLWSDGGFGTTTLPVTLFGRVDGYDGLTGQIRMDGKANGSNGLKEFTLTVTTEKAEDGLYRFTATLTDAVDDDAEVVEEGMTAPEGKKKKLISVQQVKFGKKIGEPSLIPAHAPTKESTPNAYSSMSARLQAAKDSANKRDAERKNKKK